MTAIAPWAAIGSALSGLVAAVTIALFFSTGEPWGTINDVASFLQWLLAIPIVGTVYLAQRELGVAAAMTAALGVLSLVIACVLTLLLLTRVLSFQQQGIPTAIAAGVYGAWLVFAALLWIGSSPLPPWLLAVQALAGLGIAAGVVGFVLLGQSQWLTYVGGALGSIAYPAWGLGFGYLMIRTPDILRI